jgi:hypothetical protein
VLDVRNEYFGDRMLSNRFPERFLYGWPLRPSIPDPNPCSHFIWGFLEVTLYRNNLHTIKELKKDILAAMISIIEETLAQIVQTFQHHLQMVMDTSGAHIENPFM